MDTLPDILFVVDTKKEEAAIREAKKIGIPVVAMIDTNCDPDLVDYPYLPMMMLLELSNLSLQKLPMPS